MHSIASIGSTFFFGITAPTIVTTQGCSSRQGKLSGSERKGDDMMTFFNGEDNLRDAALKCVASL